MALGSVFGARQQIIQLRHRQHGAEGGLRGSRRIRGRFGGSSASLPEHARQSRPTCSLMTPFVAMSSPGSTTPTSARTWRWPRAQLEVRHEVDGLRDIDRAAAGLSRRTRVLSVMDREADCFELFDEQRHLDAAA